MSNPILELQNLTLAFGGTEEEVILKDVDMKVYAHDVIVLIGPSGGGKTVLLKTLAGLYQPTKGKALCYGHEWTSLSMMGRHDLAQKIGMQFQKSALFDDLTTIENVAYPLREHTQLSEAEIYRRAMECLAAVNLDKAKDLEPHELSGGMRQRLGIARALALKPEILFLDDPTAGLDPINSDKMVDLVLDLKREIAATLILVTHSLAIAYQFAGRIFFVASKAVIETGSEIETKNHPDPRVQQFIHGRVTGPLTAE